MEKSLINASLSTENLTFRRGSSPVSFEVTVNNDSDQFVNFQVEVSAAGENPNTAYSWYKLTPEVAAAQPHGSSTQFQVLIFDTPITGFVGTVNLTVKIFSPQLRQQRRLLLRLLIESDGRPALLSVDLPVRNFQVYPRNTVDIPARVRNLGQQSTNVVLRFNGIDPSWVVGGGERRLFLDPGKESEVIFQCQPPSLAQAPSQNYPFTIEATGSNSVPAKGEANLEVLPIGFIEFSVPQNQQKIPQKRGWFSDTKSNSTTFELLFKNASNLNQEVNFKIQGRDWRKCNFNINPQDAKINIAETTKVYLDVKTKRPWVGIGKTLLLEARSELSDQRLGSTDPATQTLELKILPIIPLWLQLAILALLAALLALLLRPTPIGHTQIVESVRLSNDVLSVVSGSDDCTIRRWTINTNFLGSHLKPEGRYNSRRPVACGIPQQPDGLLAIPNQGVQVLRFIPVDQDRVAAGLESGAIQIWNIPTARPIQELIDQQNTNGDRVFDLVYTKDSTKLFSGYAFGEIRLWSAPSSTSKFSEIPKVINLQNKLNLSGFQVRALALSPDEKILAIGGNYQRFVLWRWNESQNALTQQVLNTNAGQNNYIWGVAFAPTKKEQEKILATSDSDGMITIWDLNQCQNYPKTQNQVPEIKCKVIDQWQAGTGSVRSLAFNQIGSFLVSGGDDGRVMVWFLTSEYKLDKVKSAEGKEIYRSTKPINSVDVKPSNPGSMIVSGGDDHQVNLKRFDSE